jgi:uncharacterized protein (TIGR02996 family)
MRTFQFSDAKSHKFWNIDLQGKSFTVTYGRVGSAGQTQTKTFATEALAQKEHDKFVKEKLGKGYSETTPSAAPQPSSLREALEAALMENPDDTAAHMAYADWLTEQGDPKGEFIQVQMRLEQEGLKAADRKKLQQREQQLLKKHRTEWLGTVADLIDNPPPVQYESSALKVRYGWARGWLDWLQIDNLSVEVSRRLAAATETRLLRRLEVLEDIWEDPGEYPAGPDVPEEAERPSLYPLTRAKHLGNVRILQLGEQADHFLQQQTRNDCFYNCRMTGEGAVGIIKLMPKLEELYLLANNVDVEQLFSLKTLHNLRIMQVYHLHRYPLSRLAKNPSLGRLTHLLIHPHAIEDLEEPPITLEGFRAVVRATNLPSLTHLQLRLTLFGDRGIEEIVKSGILKRLKFLDLRGGGVSDEGAKLLADCPDVTNLQVLDLSRNQLTKAGLNLLKKTGIAVRAGEQWQGDPDEGGEGYMFEGDIE